MLIQYFVSLSRFNVKQKIKMIKNLLKRKNLLIKPFFKQFHASSIKFNLTQSYYSSESKYPLSYETIGKALEKASDKYGDRDAHVFLESGERVTFAQLKKKSEDIASGLLGLGFKRGDRLGVWAPNCLEWILTQYATALIGVIQVNINPAYKAYELEYSLKKVGCAGIVMYDKLKNQNYLEMLLNICPELETSKPGNLNSLKLPALKNVISVCKKDHHQGTIPFNKLETYGDAQTRKALNQISSQIQASDAINIQYTSGTTGNPKAVVLSHHMILNNILQVGRLLDYQKKQQKICIQVPLYHCFGMVLGSLSTIAHGATAVYPGTIYNPTNSLKAIMSEKCTTIYGTPTMYIDLLIHPELKNYDVSSLENGIMSGSTCPPEVIKQCVEFLNMKNIVVVYGSTELSPVVSGSSITDSLEMRTQTIGKPLEHLECKVVNDKMEIVAINEPGELLVRGYSSMIEYYDDREKTIETYTTDRFFKTGDVVSMNEYGYMRHLSRLKDIVIRGGENIYPREVEDFLHNCEKIADVYVVGVPDKRMGEELCACVKLEVNQTMTVDELKEFCKNKISHFKIPRYVLFMNDFPMTVTGKIQKNKLREIVIKNLELVN